MRTIKFRGKRVDTGEWEYGCVVYRPDGAVAIAPHENYDAYAVIPETVGQLMTKVKRDNGDIEEIFEGDLIIHGERILKVLVHNGNTILTNKDETTGILLSFNDGKKKVGNIHDNIELITN